MLSTTSKAPSPTDIDMITEAIPILLAILVLRSLSTTASVAGGGVGGLFIPLVVAGALTGSIIGNVVDPKDSALGSELGMLLVQGGRLSRDHVVDEQPLFVEPYDALDITGWDLIDGDSPCGDPDRVAEGNGVGEVGERCELVESGVGDDDDVGGDSVEEREHAARSRRQDVLE